MAAFISMIIGALTLTLVSAVMFKAIESDTLEKNSVIGFRTKSTLASEQAWRAGHQATVPFLKFNSIIGIVGAIASIIFPLMSIASGNGFNDWFIILPMSVFFIQFAVILCAAMKANAAAKASL